MISLKDFKLLAVVKGIKWLGKVIFAIKSSEKVSGLDIHRKVKVHSLLEILQLFVLYFCHVFSPLIKTVYFELFGSLIKNCRNFHVTTDIPY